MPVAPSSPGIFLRHSTFTRLHMGTLRCAVGPSLSCLPFFFFFCVNARFRAAGGCWEHLRTPPSHMGCPACSCVAVALHARSALCFAWWLRGSRLVHTSAMCPKC